MFVLCSSHRVKTWRDWTHTECCGCVVHHRAVVVGRAEETVRKYVKVPPHSWPHVLVVDPHVAVPVSPVLLVAEPQDVEQFMLDDP